MNKIPDLSEKILSAPYHDLIFREHIGCEVYLVGGYLRDLLLNREGLERDYVFSGDPSRLFGILIKNGAGRRVAIGNRGLQRIITREGATLDFTPMSDTIERDLDARDYTVNALAWSPATGLIVKGQGIGDLKSKVIRMVAVQNIAADPVRIVRAYRIAEQLGFGIEAGTRVAIQQVSRFLPSAQTERITLEFFKLLNLETAPNGLRGMLNDGVLQCIITCKDEPLDQQLQVLSRIKSSFKNLHFKYAIMLSETCSQALTWRGLLFLEVLLKGSAQASLVLSNKIRRRLKLLSAADRLGEKPGNRALSFIYDVCEAAGEAAPDYMITRETPQYLPEVERFNVLMKSGLVRGEEVRSALGKVEPSRIGTALRTLRRGEFCGEIATRQQAFRALEVFRGPEDI